MLAADFVISSDRRPLISQARLECYENITEKTGVIEPHSDFEARMVEEQVNASIGTSNLTEQRTMFVS
jgi:hypothetical protein